MIERQPAEQKHVEFDEPCVRQVERHSSCERVFRPLEANLVR